MSEKTKKSEAIDGNGRAKWWRREGRSSKSFKYFDADGKRVRAKDAIERIKMLVIPPAWSEVRICPRAGGKLQAVGIDAAGRIQYLYHQSFSERQNKKKFAKIEKFGKYLPALRARTNRDIRLKGFPRDKVLAIMIRLVNSLYMRVGGEASAKSFRTYGITTLKNDHLSIRNGSELVFDYVGKSHIRHRKVLADKRLADLMSDLRRIGTSKKLFHYLDENDVAQAIKPSELNNYLKSATAPEFSLKDFRTWGASVLAAASLAEMGPAETATQTKKNVVKAIKDVADELGNTPAVCRASYVHPVVLKAYERGITIGDFRPRAQRSVTKIARLEPEEKALIKLFRNGGKT